ncbi:Putative ribonuclease H protein At1g65750 [Linum perenne]
MPKENGGLGLRQARQLNKAYITKLAFTFFKDKDRLWVQILQHKYFKTSASDAVDIIASMTPPKEDSGDDDWVWGCEKSGVFTIKLAYDLIGKIENSIDGDRWKSIWKWKGPSRIRFFLWLAAKDRLLTNTARHKRGLSQDVWQGPYVEWLIYFLKSDDSLLFGIVCHNLWKARNESIFANNTDGPHSLAIRSCHWQETVERAMAWDEIMQVSHVLKRRAEIAWVAGPAGWITLNSDGSVQGQKGKAAAGGLLRDNNGNCVLAYTMNLGTCSITRAEIRGALDGIRRAWDSGYRRLEIQIDSQAVVALLSETSSRITHSHALEVLEFQDWMKRDWEVKLSHVYLEANHAADHIASRGHTVPRGSHLVDPMDRNLAYFIRYD